ncbi:hypothetical protein [Aequorivita marisscotiae]|uniref:Uncharacterized protein n=1 Tax=Aequorivita marisscotiae TaxID=3040348 RepID=A0ABY8KT12_9FLAO|nr:hypothetical protein [Aequorivita sp. Ant34-E75]WGF92188.1 hypothetical protein QCQ61_13375 [Aequorivita sp. Ant34-E75]
MSPPTRLPDGQETAGKGSFDLPRGEVVWNFKAMYFWRFYMDF